METTATLILELFPVAQRTNRSVVELAEHVDAFTRTTVLHQKLDRFVDLFNWLRVPDQYIHALSAPGEDSKDGHSAVWKRERVWGVPCSKRLPKCANAIPNRSGHC